MKIFWCLDHQSFLSWGQMNEMFVCKIFTTMQILLEVIKGIFFVQYFTYWRGSVVWNFEKVHELFFFQLSYEKWVFQFQNSVDYLVTASCFSVEVKRSYWSFCSLIWLVLVSHNRTLRLQCFGLAKPFGGCWRTHQSQRYFKTLPTHP